MGPPLPNSKVYLKGEMEGGEFDGRELRARKLIPRVAAQRGHYRIFE
jgi:hypothetical protein